jgi:hypothetical protein
MKINLKKRVSQLTLLFATTALLGGCAHQIAIGPLTTPVRNDASLSPKKPAYVMTDANRNLKVTTEGGGGDKVSYYPYRELEKSVREALRAVYSDVFVVKSTADSEVISANDISYIFTPEITTTSGSESMFTWPPTHFNVDLSCTVVDPKGNVISQFKVLGVGNAEFSEFKGNFGLAGQRAASDVSERLKQAILSNPTLH